jgi:MOSC domain-containing protein YiiM
MKIMSLNIGLPRTYVYGTREVRTSGYREAVPSAWLSVAGFVGDEASDNVNHGGPDKAINVYPFEHYAHWQEVFGHPLPVAAFSENLTLTHCAEGDVCIGDVYRIGHASDAPLVEVSQPRMPCYKLALKHDRPHLVEWVVRAGYTGFYLRVLREGQVEREMSLTLTHREHDPVSIADINRVYYERPVDRALAERILAAPAFSASGRAIVENRLAG